MIDWIQVKNILINLNIDKIDQQLIKSFLKQFSFPKRQQLMRILVGFPEKIPLFLDLIKKKKTLVDNYDLLLAKDILNLEESTITDLISEIKSD